MKNEGRKVIGYLSALCPIEILTAAGVIPIRLRGNATEAITKADAYMETMVCPFVRNVFDTALKGKYAFLDGMVLPHQCDSMDRTYDVWSRNLRFPYWHFLNYPHLADDPSIEFTREILRIFIKTLEEFTGTPITDHDLAQAVKAHNWNRQAMRELYELRKGENPLISGAEMMKVLVAAMSLPVGESTILIKGVTNELKARQPHARPRKVRLMLVGDQIDDVVIMEAMEGKGACVTMDDLSIGSKMYWGDVEATADPIQGIAERYLRKLKIPTTFVGSGETYGENLEARFGHMRRYIREFRIKGVILFVYKYCDPYGFEVPAVKEFIESAGTPVLCLEDEYGTSSLGRMQTRIEAFVEMVEFLEKTN